MKKSILLLLAFVSIFYLGFAFKSLTSSDGDEKPERRKVTGIGGIFFKCKDPVKLKEWYNTSWYTCR
jgi:hypothetical protein